MGIISFCLACIILICTPIVLFSLSFVTRNPRMYIVDMYIPGLINTSTTQSTATRLNTFIFIDLKLWNRMPLNGIRYGDVNLTFFYGGIRSTNATSVANYTLPGFYQGHHKTAHKREVVRTLGLPWEDAYMAVSNGSKVVLGVDLVTSVRLGTFGIFGKRKALVVKGDVELDGSGEIVKHKTVRLR